MNSDPQMVDIIPPEPIRRKKRGPKTQKGRLAVVDNAVRHGLTSREPTMPGEDPAEWAAFRQSIIDDRDPSGAVEEELCDRIATLFWRLRRVAPYEAETVAIARDSVEADYQKLHQWNWGDEPPEKHLIAENEACAEAASILGVTGDPGRALSNEAAREFVAAITDGDEDLGSQELPGFEGVEGLPGGIFSVPPDEWSIASVNCALVALAEVEEIPLANYIQQIYNRLQARIRGRDEAIARYHEQKTIMARRSLIPAPMIMISLSKYESHLNRQLAQALAHLDSLQSRRHGTPIPTQVVHFSTGS